MLSCSKSKGFILPKSEANDKVGIPPGLLDALLEIADAEGAGTVLIDTGTAIATESVHERVTKLRRIGLKVVSVSTDEDPFTALIRHFRARGDRR